MSAQRHQRRITWNALKRAVEEMPRQPMLAAGRLRFRECIAWHGRCPAFRPLTQQDERRGRMAHHED